VATFHASVIWSAWILSTNKVVSRVQRFIYPRYPPFKYLAERKLPHVAIFLHPWYAPLEYLPQRELFPVATFYTFVICPAWYLAQRKLFHVATFYLWHYILVHWNCFLYYMFILLFVMLYLFLLYCKLGRFPHPHEFVLPAGFTEKWINKWMNTSVICPAWILIQRKLFHVATFYTSVICSAWLLSTKKVVSLGHVLYICNMPRLNT
jgi:hypothetical protein